MTYLPLALLLLACGGAAPGPAPGEAPDVDPASGWYRLDIAVETTWACAGQPPSEQEADRASSMAEIRVSERGDSATWRWADAYDPLECALDGGALSCLVYDTHTSEGDEAERTALRETRRIEAAWVSDEAIEGELVLELDCAGDGCDEAAIGYGEGFVFPCVGSRPLSASLSDG